MRETAETHRATDVTTPSSASVKVVIVVVGYNATSYARKMLRSVHRTRGVPYEIVVVDNDRV
jgi:hypothetical protein